MRRTIALVLLCLAVSATTAVAEPPGPSMTIETVESGADGPAVERLDAETWQVPKEARPVSVSGTTSHGDGTVVTLRVVHDNETIRVGETDAEDGRWNATVEFGDVPTGTHTLKATAGTATATAQIELVHVLRPPSVTPTETAVTPPDDATAVSTTERTATATRTETETTTATATPTTTSTDAPGFTLGVASVAVAAAAGFVARQRR